MSWEVLCGDGAEAYVGAYRDEVRCEIGGSAPGEFVVYDGVYTESEGRGVIP